MGKSTAGRAVTQPRLRAAHEGGSFGRFKKFDVHGISIREGTGFHFHARLQPCRHDPQYQRMKPVTERSVASAPV
jgi:hypothetical protein